MNTQAEALPTVTNRPTVPPELANTLAEEFAELFRAHLPPELARAISAYAMARNPVNLASMADFSEWCEAYHGLQLHFAGQQ